MSKRRKIKWPKLKVEYPNEVFVDMLLYWDDLLRPSKHSSPHANDVKRDAEVRAAIKTLLNFVA